MVSHISGSPRGAPRGGVDKGCTDARAQRYGQGGLPYEAFPIGFSNTS